MIQRTHYIPLHTMQSIPHLNSEENQDTIKDNPLPCIYKMLEPRLFLLYDIYKHNFQTLHFYSCFLENCSRATDVRSADLRLLLVVYEDE